MSGRPRPSARTFHCQLVEDKLQSLSPAIKNAELRRMFEQCWPNSLDTTVFAHDGDLKEKDHQKARPTTWVITGDIPALWLRDSANQMAAYIPLLLAPSSSSAHWTALYRLILGLLYTQAECILLHPFSNAFIPPTSKLASPNRDRVHPPPPTTDKDEGIRIWESKWELDSLASFLALSHQLIAASGRLDPLLNPRWRAAVRLVLEVCRLQQRGTDEEEQLLGAPWNGPLKGPEGQAEITEGRDEEGEDGRGERRYEGREGVYRFQRHDWAASETRSLRGLGEPGKRCGLVKSAFRPSDDSTVLPFLIPSNAFLSVGLATLAEIVEDAFASGEELAEDEVGAQELDGMAREMRALGEEVRAAVWEHGVVTTSEGERVFAYEVDGFGSHLIADDANLPSLLSLPHLGFLTSADPVYRATRRLLLDGTRNKWYVTGKVAEGIGGMHIGSGFIWPMSLICRALTSEEDEEILDCLGMLKRTTAGTGFIHESFYKDDATNFTRSWFAWANGLFGQLILKLAEERPYLL